MDFGQILLISILILFAGFCFGTLFAVKSYKNNRYKVVLPGQTWYLPGCGAVKVIHSSEPGSEILYVYNLEDDYTTAMGTCSRLDLIKGGFLIDMSTNDHEVKEESPPSPPDLKIIEFPFRKDDEDD